MLFRISLLDLKSSWQLTAVITNSTLVRLRRIQLRRSKSKRQLITIVVFLEALKLFRIS